ncbi:MAG: hypothetical protein JO040_01500 [Gemmatimonadetes bacterium]|nr:hypothetical protein [Gemmatimonadota bacterium]
MDLQAGRFVDLHNHVVPGVDGGSPSLVETIRSLRAFRSEGVGVVAVTPHLDPARHAGTWALRRRLDELQASYEMVCDAAAGRLHMPALTFSQEVHARDADAVRRVVEDPRVGVGGGRFVLVEFDAELAGEPLKTIRTVRAAGREILVAHPERYHFPWSPDPLDTLRRWVDAGAWLQVSLGSLTDGGGPYGEGAERLAWSLLGEGMVHALASDHLGGARPQILHRAVARRLAAHGGGAQALQLLAGNPRRIVGDRLPEPVPPLRAAVPA